MSNVDALMQNWSMYDVRYATLVIFCMNTFPYLDDEGLYVNCAFNSAYMQVYTPTLNTNYPNLETGIWGGDGGGGGGGGDLIIDIQSELYFKSCHL